MIRRSVIRPVSKKRQATRYARERCVNEVLRRANYQCQTPGWSDLECKGRLDVHEVLSRARGGDPLNPDACAALCAQHHRYAHAHPDEAAGIGILRHSWDSGDAA